MIVASDAGSLERTVVAEAGDASLEGTLALPPAARGVVVFAHGSGSSRFLAAEPVYRPRQPARDPPAPSRSDSSGRAPGAAPRW